MVDIATPKGVGTARRISTAQAMVEGRGLKRFDQAQPFLDTNLQTSTMGTATNKPLFSIPETRVTSPGDLFTRTRIEASMGKKVVTPTVTQKPLPAVEASKPGSLSYGTGTQPIPNALEAAKTMVTLGFMFMALSVMANALLSRQKRLKN